MCKVLLKSEFSVEYVVSSIQYTLSSDVKLLSFIIIRIKRVFIVYTRWH